MNAPSPKNVLVADRLCEQCQGHGFTFIKLKGGGITKRGHVTVQGGKILKEECNTVGPPELTFRAVCECVQSLPLHVTAGGDYRLPKREG